MTVRGIHLVGSIPLQDAAEVFRVVTRVLGPSIRRIPDGETGERSHWLGWVEPVFANNPAFEPTGEFSRSHAASDPRPLHRLRSGYSSDRVQFENLRIAETAVQSFAIFQELKRTGAVDPACRFQVCVANPVSVVERFIVADEQEAIVPIYEQALIEEIERLLREIPHDQLAVQFDIAQHVFKPLEIGEGNRYGATREAMLDAYTAMAARWSEAIPADVELIFHLCYGDNAHRHAIEPATLDVQVDFANATAARVTRSIQLFHMSVPRNRDDDAYFAPLRRLNVPAGTEIALGLVHYTDGVVGSRRRLATAEKFIDNFLIGTECGFGRRPPDTVLDLLRIHAELAGQPAA